jgi:hypothetical protein
MIKHNDRIKYGIKKEHINNGHSMAKYLPQLLKAIDDKRMTFGDMCIYDYCGTTYGKDIFRNRITGEYLD